MPGLEPSSLVGHDQKEQSSMPGLEPSSLVDKAAREPKAMPSLEPSSLVGKRAQKPAVMPGLEAPSRTKVSSSRKAAIATPAQKKPAKTVNTKLGADGLPDLSGLGSSKPAALVH